MKNEECIGNIVALLTVFLWGTTFVSTRVLLDNFTPVEILVLRFSLGYCALCASSAPKIPVCSLREETLFASAGLSGVTLYFLFENIALVYTSVSNVAVLVASAPLFTAIFAFIFLKTAKPGINYYLGFLLAMAGIFLVTHNGSSMNLNLAGDLLALLAAVSWGAYSTITRKLSCRGYNSLSVTRRIFFYGLLLMFPLVFTDNFHIHLAILFQPLPVINLLFLGLGASALCFATWTFSLKILGAARASAYIYLVPVITIFSSALILKENPGYYTIIGGALTILGLIISEYNFGKNIYSTK